MDEARPEKRLARFWNWIKKNVGTGIAIVTAFIALYAARDAHQIAEHAEENTGAQILITPVADKATQWHFSVTNEGAGPAEYVRTFCILKTTGGDWKDVTAEYLDSQLATIDRPIDIHRLTTHGEFDINPVQNTTRCAHDAGSHITAQEIYILVAYSTPWNKNKPKYDDWDFTLETNSNNIWKPVSPKEARAKYHDKVVKWFERLAAEDGE